MFSELTSSFFSLVWWIDEKSRELAKFKYFLEKMTLCDVWKLFPYVFLWRWRSKGLVVLKFERCEHRDDTSIVDGVQEDVKC